MGEADGVAAAAPLYSDRVEPGQRALAASPAGPTAATAAFAGLSAATGAGGEASAEGGTPWPVGPETSLSTMS
eukprot:NODE_9759_length_329_cov_176.270073.p2 GENE.NODE_9759_length_329_cov_176.270073~~NODE_9759_length_329_cov_176.270073.p2  ORF type:complete len:73 (+),score=7.56 NODE_9759_length_329_cov_176.270073:3-221(+)